MNRIILWSLLSLVPSLASALNAVHPTGVNVNATGPTTVFLTFQGTLGQQPVDAFWCGDITVGPNIVTATNPCVPGSLFGHLPPQNNLARNSGTGGQNNTTDIMTIPASVARRAYQDAQRGNDSQFFYVREFQDAGGNSQFIAVTCRMAGGGARVPFAITRVDLAFGSLGNDQPVTVLERDDTPPDVVARISFNGTGRLLGRWELVQPGDPDPRKIDLLSQASLPVEQRNAQRRYTEIGRFDVFLPPSGAVFLPGPSVDRIPTRLAGQYKILLRIEATSDKEGDSQTANGVANSGGVAGFTMPVLRYVVAGEPEPDVARKVLAIDLNIDREGQNWVANWPSSGDQQWLLLRFEFAGHTPFEAVVDAASGRYELPPWWDADNPPQASASTWHGE